MTKIGILSTENMDLREHVSSAAAKHKDNAWFE
jgi:hypothetical protein